MILTASITSIEISVTKLRLLTHRVWWKSFTCHCQPMATASRQHVSEAFDSSLSSIYTIVPSTTGLRDIHVSVEGHGRTLINYGRLRPRCTIMGWVRYDKTTSKIQKRRKKESIDSIEQGIPSPETANLNSFRKHFAYLIPHLPNFFLLYSFDHAHLDS